MPDFQRVFPGLITCCRPRRSQTCLPRLCPGYYLSLLSSTTSFAYSLLVMLLLGSVATQLTTGPVCQLDGGICVAVLLLANGVLERKELQPAERRSIWRTLTSPIRMSSPEELKPAEADESRTHQCQNCGKVCPHSHFPKMLPPDAILTMR
ncbi:unnamed protein product [Pleuronectes platessa]|uniref:Uncharacterized protein n=1 Tax=Pleuronectes platessa TaxID=8262 RepID=A0A9N7UMQ6_PLEPL|nr:unnamed protein product [Pleuronectes platessa]